MLRYRQLFIKGNVFIGVCGIFGAYIFLCYSQFFIKGDFVIGRVECTSFQNRKMLQQKHFFTHQPGAPDPGCFLLFSNYTNHCWSWGQLSSESWGVTSRQPQSRPEESPTMLTVTEADSIQRSHQQATLMLVSPHRFFKSSFSWEGMVVLKELIFKFLLWENMVVLKEQILTVSTLGGCGGLETSDF